MSSIFTLFALIPFYLIGALPTGYLLGRLRGVDIHDHGSGNVGATNVSRVLGKKLGALTLVLDVAKGYLVVLLANLISDNPSFLGASALAAVSGHCFSIPKVLHGGKGVATTLGVGLYLSPIAAISSLLIFIFILIGSRIVSVASMVAIAASPIAAGFCDTPDPQVTALAIIALIVVFQHRKNLARLTQGSEKKFSENKIAASPN